VNEGRNIWPTQILSHPFYVGVKKPQGYYGNVLLWWYAGCIYFLLSGVPWG
jgi:hypothetical protein